MPGAIGLASEYFLGIVVAPRALATKTVGRPWRGPCASSRIRATFGLTFVKASPRGHSWTSNEYAAKAVLWVSNSNALRR